MRASGERREAAALSPKARLGLDLVRAAPLTLLSESKAERDYHLADGTQPEARKPPPIDIDFRRPLPDAGRHPSDARGHSSHPLMRSLLALFDGLLEPHAAAQFEGELRRLGRVLGTAPENDNSE